MTNYVLLTLGAVLWLFPRGQGVPQYLLGFVFFLLLVSGNTLFGILESRPVKFLGVISYSIYLLHNIVISVVFYHFYQIQEIDSVSPVIYWSVTAACGVIVVLLSAFCYRFVEYPFLVQKPPSVTPKVDLAALMRKIGQRILLPQIHASPRTAAFDTITRQR